MTDKIERILIAVKPWEDRLPISNDRVTALARGLGAEVALTSCLRLSAATELSWMDAAVSMDFDIAKLDRVADQRAILERLAEPLRAAGATVATRVRSEGSADRGILGEVEDWEADLLIAGVHEPNLVPHPRLLDVDWQLIRLCPCPLLLARGRKTEPYRSILAAVDPLHGHAEPPGLDHAILGAAQQVCDAFDASLQVISVYPHPDEFEVVSSVEVQPGVFYGSENVEAVHRQAAIDLVSECKVSDADLLVRPGKPATVIAETAREQAADLIVLGSIKRSRLHAMLLGSTAEIIVDVAESDVLLLKPPAN